ncbi:MAG: hypothetical protein KDE35_14390 [Geminicoccaceae bacterium]|nr:hypothetical protein [Geminicoccaceae bacterium]
MSAGDPGDRDDLPPRAAAPEGYESHGADTQEATRALARTVIVSAADSVFFDLLEGLLGSLARLPALARVPIAVFDLGLREAQRQALVERGVLLLRARPHLGVDPSGSCPIVPGVLVRPFLADYLPDHEVHVWIDADAWVQDWRSILRLSEGARAEGLAAVAESEPRYVTPLWQHVWHAKHCLLGFGPRVGMALLRRPMINAGVFAMAAGAPQAACWQRRFGDAVRRTGRVAPYDQFTLNQAVWLDGQPARLLDPRDNWICNRALPGFDPVAERFCLPYAPFEPLGILHLAGHLKAGRVAVPTTDGKRHDVRLGFEIA